MIKKNIRTNNEYYVCPTFNEAIQDGKKIKIFPIKKMWGLGDPESLLYFQEHYHGASFDGGRHMTRMKKAIEM